MNELNVIRIGSWRILWRVPTCSQWIAPPSSPRSGELKLTGNRQRQVIAFLFKHFLCHLRGFWWLGEKNMTNSPKKEEKGEKGRIIGGKGRETKKRRDRWNSRRRGAKIWISRLIYTPMSPGYMDVSKCITFNLKNKTYQILQKTKQKINQL